MEIGRSNSVASETRASVSWKVERAPNKDRNCLGRTSREAGHSRVPAPPHMTNGMIRLSIRTSKLVMIAIPRDKVVNPILNGSRGREAYIAHQIPDVSKGFRYISRLHGQHIPYRLAAQFFLQKRYHMGQLFRMTIANI